VQRFTQDR